MAARRIMEGTLLRWGGNNQIAFRTGNFTRHVIFIGGLTDGLLATRYVPPLSEALQKENWSLVQTLLSSSYSGYGTSSLDQDAAELEELLRYLVTEENSEAAVLVGHSTGCQDIVHLLKIGAHVPGIIKGAVLQAPVSDREYMATLPETAGALALAEKMIADGRAEELMPRALNPMAPITAGRFLSLGGKGGQDDLFSSDLPDEELCLKLGHMAAIPCQVLFSMDDEYVPSGIDKGALAKRLATALGASSLVEIKSDHALSTAIPEAVQAIVEFVKSVGLSPP